MWFMSQQPTTDTDVNHLCTNWQHQNIFKKCLHWSHFHLQYLHLPTVIHWIAKPHSLDLSTLDTMHALALAKCICFSHFGNEVSNECFFIMLWSFAYNCYQLLKAFVLKGSPLTAADLGSCLNFPQLASWAKFKQEANLLQ